MSELIHVAALGGLVVLLARLSLMQWGGGFVRRPIVIRADREVRRRWPGYDG
jgi:hypothetical protein